MQKVVMSAILSAVLLLQTPLLWAQAPVKSFVLSAEDAAGSRVEASGNLLAEKPDSVQLSRVRQESLRHYVSDSIPQHTKQELPLPRRRIYRVR
ncbi:hypothetical protein SAMN04487941_1586 [Pontibacter akesuensis]|uniref:Uncharacterized protein n=1 Tax=Pontibacter akesuensis TaxID=388950 RepID=A0A1I7HQ58_9BACT|nr:hypothetical protein GCM10007389_14270 [Pontibacter akesuensis]SFU62817.1 hypothetical protein SAMN04487941_1586 [Pontibacter akesuensis]